MYNLCTKEEKAHPQGCALSLMDDCPPRTSYICPSYILRTSYICTSYIGLFVLAIGSDGAEGHSRTKEREGEEMRVYFPEASSADIDRSDSVNEIVHRVDIGRRVRPHRHGTDRGEESAEEHQEDDEEPHDEDCLLHVAAEIRDRQAERRDEKRQEHCQ